MLVRGSRPFRRCTGASQARGFGKVGDLRVPFSALAGASEAFGKG